MVNVCELKKVTFRNVCQLESALAAPTPALVRVKVPDRAQNVALLADHLYTMDTGPQGGPGMVLIRDGKVEEVQAGANGQPPAGFQVIHGAYVTPGLIDADTTTVSSYFCG